MERKRLRKRFLIYKIFLHETCDHKRSGKISGSFYHHSITRHQNTRKVNEPTRQRVLDAMRDLNFQPIRLHAACAGETKTIV